MPTPIYTFAACSDKGSVRQNNEDNFFIQGQAPMPPNASAHYATFTGNLTEGVAAVFDGMGGESYGAEASSLAARVLASNPIAVLNSGDIAIPQYIKKANELVCDLQAQKKARIGSTMTIASVKPDSIMVYNLGDSPAYLFSGGRIQKLSRDHTVTQQLVNMGLLTPEQALTDSRRHQLTQHIGIDQSELALQEHCSGPVPFGSGDCLLLCSDGLTEGLSEREICSIIASGGSAERIAAALVEQAILGGSRDNVTAVVVKSGDAIFDFSYESEQTIDNGGISFEPGKGEPFGRGKTALLWVLCVLFAFGTGLLWYRILELL